MHNELKLKKKNSKNNQQYPNKKTIDGVRCTKNKNQKHYFGQLWPQNIINKNRQTEI